MPDDQIAETLNVFFTDAPFAYRKLGGESALTVTKLRNGLSVLGEPPGKLGVTSGHRAAFDKVE